MPRPVPQTSRWRAVRARLGKAAKPAQIKAYGTVVPGLGLIDAAFFQLGSLAGLLATGVSFLVLNWLVND